MLFSSMCCLAGCFLVSFFFFFKQKTAYEILRSDWSSDVCSSDLAGEQMVRFILAENYRQPPDIGPVEADGTCLRCGEPGLEAVLQDQYFVLRCPDCERPTFTYRVTPAQARSHAEADLV